MTESTKTLRAPAVEAGQPLKCAFVVVFFAATCLLAQQSPQPEARDSLSGTISSWGSAQMAELMALWERSFQRHHLGVHFDDQLKGTVSGIGLL